MHFSLIPPTGSTFPFNEISPVIATSDLAFCPFNSDTYFYLILSFINLFLF